MPCRTALLLVEIEFFPLSLSRIEKYKVTMRKSNEVTTSVAREPLLRLSISCSVTRTRDSIFDRSPFFETTPTGTVLHCVEHFLVSIIILYHAILVDISLG